MYPLMQATEVDTSALESAGSWEQLLFGAAVIALGIVVAIVSKKFGFTLKKPTSRLPSALLVATLLSMTVLSGCSCNKLTSESLDQLKTYVNRQQQRADLYRGEGLITEAEHETWSANNAEHGKIVDTLIKEVGE